MIDSVRVTLTPAGNPGQNTVFAKVTGSRFTQGSKVLTQFIDVTANPNVAFARATVTAGSVNPFTGEPNVNTGRIAFTRFIGTTPRLCGHTMRVEARYGPRFALSVSRKFVVAC